ncbi:hypothetical protein AOQ84DRAFT_284541 [Glonium stellatum]|uniref:Uncharacterized protein n=1 Tax=Glonium stellatum TaxID=574774 RepID=A0A8E2F9I7_9PEZI|nr:hypothetical protein AOQ84DRAFT_284541 [Glonium stellatum]
MPRGSARVLDHQSKGKAKVEEEDYITNDERVLLDDEKLDEGVDEDADEETRLKYLATAIRDQDDLERDIGRQADQLITEQADERDNKRLEKTEAEKQRFITQLRKLEQRLLLPAGSTTKNKIRQDIAHAEAKIETLETELKQIQKRIDDRHKPEDGKEVQGEVAGNQPLPNESRRDFLIRTGKITPFSRMAQVPRTSSNLADVMLDAEAEDENDEDMEEYVRTESISKGPVSHRNLMKPGFMDEGEDADGSPSPAALPVKRPTKRRRVEPSHDAAASPRGESSVGNSVMEESDDAYNPEMDDRQLAAVGESEEEPNEDMDEDYLLETPARKRKQHGKKSRVTKPVEEEKEDLTGVDDGNEKVYENRMRFWAEGRYQARKRAQTKRTAQGNRDEIDEASGDSTFEQECYQPHPTRPDAEFDGGYRIPGDIYPSLFDYQKTGVQWLWELYSQQVGGIIGDEMGLGKTIQAISFLAGLHYSKKLTKPIIVVTPATVMKQWVNEFHRWWPPLRVSILHTSGSGMMDTRRESQLERELESRDWDDNRPALTKSGRAAKRIVDKVKRDGHVLVTTYSGLQTYAEFLIPTDWEYAVLDEGHKIRNPNAAITIYCKELRTANRVILSGTPMQNNLTELWSLFDFVFPMRLGTLVNFRNQFEFPIKQGGYANASNLQVETAMKCAETLKETISAYLLQRFKVDVAADLPKKSERVLFCKLTRQQREAYEKFLSSEEMKSIMNGKRQMLFGVDILRKICNHPDLVEHKTLSKKPKYNYGTGAKSGKMQVVKALLEIWKKGGHKTLLFAQHRIMLDILEKFVKTMDGFNYRRMDGTTAIKDRQDVVDEFNRDPDLHVFLLTTKVGGLGVNLTGADRVIIYDPDWNPSTDIQARERAWRLGQKREVEIYRLMTAGTIEEKIYHRQIFKQFLTNKILKDPKQRQTFQLRDLQDLFTLGGENDGATETGNLFKGTEVKFSDKQPDATEQNQGMPTPPTETEPAHLKTAKHSNLAAITGVSRQEDYAVDDFEQATDAEGSGGNANDGKKDDRLLSTIFARSGVHSALEHDAILNSNSRKPKVTADPEIIAREARRVASEAARELQRAGELARTVPVGTPTWTGTFGTAGRPEERPRGLGAGRGGRGGGSMGRGGGPSSSSILANLAARQTGSPGGGASSASSRAATPQQTQPRGREFLALIRDYLVAHGGKVHTQMLIDHFNRFCGTPQRTAEFKEMLKRIAVLEKGSTGRGKWVLKDEFRPTGR